MAIAYNESTKTFKLDTEHTTYAFGVQDEFGYLLHYYYGAYVSDDNLAYLARTTEAPFTPTVNPKDKTSFLDCAPYEYPTGGLGDFRDHCLEIRTSEGFNALELAYASYEIRDGKGRLPGLPATFGEAGQVQCLDVTLEDKILGLQVVLQYGVFPKEDVITRSVKIVNVSNEKPIYLTKVLSTCLDMDNKDYSILTMHGSWARERRIETRPIGHTRTVVCSERGESSHQDHPFLALQSPNATQTTGEVFGFHFIYSGNFEGCSAMDQFGGVRTMMGISPYNFCWKLAKGEQFQAPEVAMTYSDEGFTRMTHSYHNLYRKHLIRSPYKDKKRPILINNWEATYFDFNTDKLLDIARQASKLGIEMLVMDDGWFGNRCDDNRALGDWYVNEEKLPGGLKYLVDEVNKLGMKFGIWFEPEMISPDSDLYRAHPDWAIGVPGRKGGLCRNQYVLDLTRPEVLEHTWNSIATILRSANIEYVKWDMNRQLAELGSYRLDPDCQGELYHRYMLAVYELQERLLREFPHLLLENCSGGGARFDPGMLFYSPQIWCSDDTDAIERLKIQEGTALIYPLSTMGAHVSVCPNHTVGRVTPFSTRGHVALAGTFGYELDVTKIPEEERNAIPGQVEMYHKYNDLVRNGEYYRIASCRENNEFDCWEVVSEQQDEALITFVQILNRPNFHSRRILVPGLNPSYTYVEEETGKEYSGEVLSKAGLPIANMWGDFQSKLIHLRKK